MKDGVNELLLLLVRETVTEFVFVIEKEVERGQNLLKFAPPSTVYRELVPPDRWYLRSTADTILLAVEV